MTPAPAPDPAPPPATSPGGAAIPAEDAIESGKPAADEPDVGTVRVTGNAEQVWLLGAGEQRYRPGKVPSGRYKVMARFPGEDKDIHAADVSVRSPSFCARPV